jgi:hypothetical protein
VASHSEAIFSRSEMKFDAIAFGNCISTLFRSQSDQLFYAKKECLKRVISLSICLPRTRVMTRTVSEFHQVSSQVQRRYVQDETPQPIQAHGETSTSTTLMRKLSIDKIPSILIVYLMHW